LAGLGGVEVCVVANLGGQLVVCGCLCWGGLVDCTLRVRVHFDSELRIPLIPAFTLVYMSIYALFAAAPFVLRSRRELKALANAQALAILIAGICFLLVPAQLAYAPATDSQLGMWKGIFNFASRLSLDYNLAPSLHVALSIICIEILAIHANFGGKCLLRAWGFLIAAATLIIHRHHVVDAVTGYLLALAIVRLVSRRQH
jgi:membrane-associated phospholipid phosphatase